MIHWRTVIPVLAVLLLPVAAAAAPAGPGAAAAIFGAVGAVGVGDPYPLGVRAAKPWPTFLTVMTFAEVAMYPPKAYAGKQPADISRQPIGTGPYTFVRWAKDEEVVLEANTAWWRGEPKVKTVVFRPIPDDAVRVAALQNGEIDVAVNIPPHLANPIPHPPRLFLATAPPVA